MVADLSGLLAAVGEKATPLERLNPGQRATVLVALLVIVLLGLFLILIAWAGARAMRRYASIPSPSSRPRRRPPDQDDWAKKPLIRDDRLESDDE